MPQIVEDLAVSGAFVVWVYLSLRMAGLELGSIVATSAVFTGIVVFSMQETLGNILGGVAVQLDNSIRIGDWVRLDDITGRVVEVRWRFTAIETRNRETVIVPNSFLMKNRFTILGSRADEEIRWRRWVWFNISLEHPPTRVCEVLGRALHNADIPLVAREPAPTVVLMDLLNGYGRYAVRYFLTDPKIDDPTDSLVREHCHAALARHGMCIAVPQEERLLISEDDAWRRALQSSELERRRTALARVEIFSVLTEAERNILATHLVPAPFVAGAVMTHQGDVAHWLYLIISGEADVWSESPDKPRQLIATLRSGDVFGEMGMLTGAARSATVTAKTHVDCYRLDKAGLAEILAARPGIAAELSEVLAKRRAELERLRAGNGAGHDESGESILGRIRGFFSLGD